jgi:hypothetical protein
MEKKSYLVQERREYLNFPERKRCENSNGTTVKEARRKKSEIVLNNVRICVREMSGV